jgi:hypothetical protein
MLPSEIGFPSGWCVIDCLMAGGYADAEVRFEQLWESLCPFPEFALAL